MLQTVRRKLRDNRYLDIYDIELALVLFISNVARTSDVLIRKFAFTYFVSIIYSI